MRCEAGMGRAAAGSTGDWQRGALQGGRKGTWRVLCGVGSGGSGLAERRCGARGRGVALRREGTRRILMPHCGQWGIKAQQEGETAVETQARIRSSPLWKVLRPAPR